MAPLNGVRFMGSGFSKGFVQSGGQAERDEALTT